MENTFLDLFMSTLSLPCWTKSGTALIDSFSTRNNLSAANKMRQIIVRTAPYDDDLDARGFYTVGKDILERYFPQVQS
jgi:hypothetical protein